MKKFDIKLQIKILKIILIIIWMITIFIFSGQQSTESEDTSKSFTIIIIQIITGKSLSLDNPFVEGAQYFVRKFAHFSIYTIGGFLIMNYAYTTEKTMKQKIIYSIVFGGIYSITDELHQFFVPGRSAQLFDVMIDTSGIIIGVIIYLAFNKILKKLSNRNKTELV